MFEANLNIAHCADIHIRSLSRHDEYRITLKAFTEDCKAQRVDHIFIGGDIFHTKTTGISPEYIDLLTWWLNDMSKIAEVHLILGNHDGNLSNLSRQDAVTPIVEAIANPRVHLYKKSGIYQIQKGWNLCVFSCFDEEGWNDVRPVEGDINIAAFHGGVRGSKTESDWEIEEGLTAEFFDDYDFCFLGDIHRPQNLGYRDGKPWIAYPGSLIQQSYAEQLDHGYLLWDIESHKKWNVKTRNLPNIKPYVTLEWIDSADDVMKSALQYPKGSRFRIKSKVQLIQSDMHCLSEFLKTSLVASEVTYKSEYQIDKQTVVTGDSLIKKNDLRSSEVVFKFLKDYHKDAKLNEKEVETLNDLVRTYLKSIKTNDETRDTKWSLKHLKWDNLFSYGEGNQINFDKLSGIVGIFGANRAGKSSVVGALMYALFNTTDRGSVKNINVCNVRKSYCYVRAVIENDGVAYVIERQTTKSLNKKGIMSAPTSLNLFRMKEEELEDLCGEQRTDTDKILRSIFGLPEDFLMTSLSVQGEINQFIEQGSSKRRSLLSKFLDLDVFDKLHDAASKEVTSYKAQLKSFPDRDWVTIENENSRQILECLESLSQLDQKILDFQSTIDILKNELSKKDMMFVDQSDVDRHSKKVEDYEEMLKVSVNRVEEIKNSIVEHNKKVSVLNELISAIDIKDIKLKLESQRVLESSINDLRHLYEKENLTYENQKKSLNILNEVPCGDEYPDCKFIKNAHEAKKLSDSQKKKSLIALEKLEDAQRSYELIKQQGLQEKIEKHQKAQNLLCKIELEISKSETELERVNLTFDSQRKSLSEATEKLDKLRLALNNRENYEAVSIRQKIKELSDMIRSHDADKLMIASKKGRLQSELDKLIEEKKKRDTLLSSAKFHELIANAFSKKGIPLLITKSQLPIINSEIFKILQGIVDFTIELENDESTDSLEIYINYGDSRRMIELCSGMEKTIASLAIRVAMVNISSLPKPDFFIIDEGFGTLDSSGVEACNRLLTSLKRYFKTIIVITHVDGIKDCVDCVLEITKNEKDSKMEYA